MEFHVVYNCGGRKSLRIVNTTSRRVFHYYRLSIPRRGISKSLLINLDFRLAIENHQAVES